MPPLPLAWPPLPVVWPPPPGVPPLPLTPAPPDAVAPPVTGAPPLTAAPPVEDVPPLPAPERGLSEALVQANSHPAPTTTTPTCHRLIESFLQLRVCRTPEIAATFGLGGLDPPRLAFATAPPAAFGGLAPLAKDRS
jgi:hypothetical protein